MAEIKLTINEGYSRPLKNEAPLDTQDSRAAKAWDPTADHVKTQQVQQRQVGSGKDDLDQGLDLVLEGSFSAILFLRLIIPELEVES
jgi:hypothetical protein